MVGDRSIAYNYTSRGTEIIFRSCIRASKLALHRKLIYVILYDEYTFLNVRITSHGSFQ